MPDAVDTTALDNMAKRVFVALGPAGIVWSGLPHDVHNTFGDPCPERRAMPGNGHSTSSGGIAVAATKRRVAVGQTIEMVLSRDMELKNGLMQKICGEVRRVRILDGCVELLCPADYLNDEHEPNRPWISFHPPFEYVGIYKDRRGLWVSPVPRRLTQVERYGKPVSVPMLAGAFAVRWLETYTSWTAVDCLRRHGYSINQDYFYSEPRS